MQLILITGVIKIPWKMQLEMIAITLMLKKGEMNYYRIENMT